jgi:hypothetical protein
LLYSSCFFYLSERLSYWIYVWFGVTIICSPPKFNYISLGFKVLFIGYITIGFCTLVLSTYNGCHAVCSFGIIFIMLKIFLFFNLFLIYEKSKYKYRSLLVARVGFTPTTFHHSGNTLILSELSGFNKWNKDLNLSAWKPMFCTFQFYFIYFLKWSPKEIIETNFKLSTSFRGMWGVVCQKLVLQFYLCTHTYIWISLQTHPTNRLCMRP